jgi:hypothetical protein
LAQEYKSLFPDTSASIPAVTTLRSSLSMYVFLYIVIFFFACFVNRLPGGYFPNCPHVKARIISSCAFAFRIITHNTFTVTNIFCGISRNFHVFRV